MNARRLIRKHGPKSVKKSSKISKGNKEYNLNKEDEEDDNDKLLEGNYEKEEETDSDDNDKYVDDSSENDSNKPLELQKDLSEVSLGDLISLKDRLGTKVFNCTAFKSHAEPTYKAVHETPLLNKYHKNKPLEASSKKKLSKHARMAAKSYAARDPRFEGQSGVFKAEQFEASYSFIDDVKRNEKMKLIKSIRREKDPEKKTKMSMLLKRMKQQEKSRERKLEEREKERQRRKQEKEKVSKGKRPYFLKKSVQRRMEDEESMQGAGAEKLKRKEKKLLAKDRKKFSFL